MQFLLRFALCKGLPISVLVLFLFWGCGATGQTESQLAVRFNKLVLFQVRPGTVALPTFAADGSVCRLEIEKVQQFESESTAPDHIIPDYLVSKLVDEVVPPNERGKPNKYLSTESWVAGGAAFIKQDYENVSVGVYGTSIVDGPNGATQIVITWRNRTCPTTR